MPFYHEPTEQINTKREQIVLQKESPFIRPERTDFFSLNYNIGNEFKRIFIPKFIAGQEEESPQITQAEWLYILDSINDFVNGEYYSSKPNETIEEFIEELQR